MHTKSWCAFDCLVAIKDIHTAAHSPKGDESHPRHSVAVERTCNTVWTHPNWVRWRTRCHTSLSLSTHNPHHRRFPSLPPSSTPTLFPAGPASHTPYRQKPLATPTQHDPTPAPTNRHRCVEPNASMYNQPRRLESSASVCDPTPASTTQHLHFEPNASVYDQHRPL